MSDNVLNNEFRDMAAKACYPFIASSTMAGDRLTLPTNFILDMVLYPVVGTPPFFLYSLTGLAEARGLQLVIKDSTLVVIGSAELQAGTDSALIYDADGLTVGVVVYGAEGFAEVMGKLENYTCYFQQEATTVNTGRSFVPAVEGTRLVKSDAGNFSGEINIAAAGGVHFAKDGDLPDEVSVNLYGELRTLTMPVKSINGVPMKHVWLMAHPGPQNPAPEPSPTPNCDIKGSELRISTKDSIKVGKARDFTYGD